MQIVDSHCHLDMLDLKAFGGNLDNVIKESKKLNVHKFLTISIGQENIATVINLAEKYDEVYASVGVHPNEISAKEITFAELIKYADNPKVIAIGETGLDYYRTDKENSNFQRERFITHIKASNHTNKPLIIHTRNASFDTINILKSENAKFGVMHCFSESWEVAKQALDLGFYISFSGIVTFKNAVKLQEVAKKIPEDRLLVETDAPFLTPHPYRGKKNIPGYTYYVVQKLAELRCKSIDYIAATSTKNFNNLFLNG